MREPWHRDWTPSEMAARYEAGYGIRRIAKLVGISRGTVRDCLQTAGVQLRQKRPQRRSAPPEMIEMYITGYSLRRIGAVVGLSAETVRKQLKAGGMVVRSRGRQKGFRPPKSGRG